MGMDLKDGEQIEMKGSAAKPYKIKNLGGVYSCDCASWRNQSKGVIRSCKHIIRLRGEEAEKERLGGSMLSTPTPEKKATAPPVLLADSWTPDIDPTNWIMSEKLDGVRAWWDGENVISRLGNTYQAPDWFKKGLPKYPLDGELWLGRKMFQKCISIVRRQDKNDEWRDIKYYVFDIPEQKGDFTRRLVGLYLLADKYKNSASWTPLEILEQQPCKGIDHLRKELARIEAKGGEGLMLRDPNSLYEAGRSSTLLKVKSVMDAEAVVISHEPGKGKHKGRLGKVVARLPNGIEFGVGTGFSDAERESPPPIGSTITFRYQELSTGGVPRFPSFVCIRED